MVQQQEGEMAARGEAEEPETVRGSSGHDQSPLFRWKVTPQLRFQLHVLLDTTTHRHHGGYLQVRLHSFQFLTSNWDCKCWVLLWISITNPKLSNYATMNSFSCYINKNFATLWYLISEKYWVEANRGTDINKIKQLKNSFFLAHYNLIQTEKWNFDYVYLYNKKS